ncbi:MULTISPECIES: serine/threonine-protein kinase [Streptomyces]|uniref:serine/threonine-protein kinase n=1 Tax=Streptomyces lycopersici TaxID=2974589 RepID=UPI0021CFDD30|nr:serine/threonine-protein kinase [Streptomyces sp. NEAU-383]
MEAGDVLDGRYRVDEPLDQGGMGSIWKAVDSETGAWVAVKVLRLDAYTQGRFSPSERTRRRAELLKRFEREGMILEELKHPAIPRLLHRGYHREEPYLVMEYVEGETLRDFLDRRRPLPLGAACAIAVDVAEALVHAHTHGVVHRDLKPGNIVLAADGAAKLLDFGIAFLTDPDATRYTVLGATPGSAGYMAPEQLRGQQTVSASVDVYALGCVLFELVTGRAPFEDQPDRNKDTQHLEDLPPRIRAFNLGLPADLDDLVWDLLSKAPADRPAHVGVALEVLRGYLPAQGEPAPEPELDPDPTARHRSSSSTGSESVRGPVDVARRPARRRAAWLGRQEFAALLRQARGELDAHNPSRACEQLSRSLERAVANWGLGESTVADAQLACADVARLEGDTHLAKPLYEQVVVALAHHRGEASRALALEARVGAAECRVPEEDLHGALQGWTDTVAEVLRLLSPPTRLVARCREVALELNERGCAATIAPLVAELEER